MQTAATIALAIRADARNSHQLRQPARQGLDFIRPVFDSIIEMRPVADRVPNNPDHTGDTRSWRVQRVNLRGRDRRISCNEHYQKLAGHNRSISELTYR